MILLEQCQRPSPTQMKTNRDLIEYLFNLEAAFGVCAAKIEAIKTYYDETVADRIKE